MATFWRMVGFVVGLILVGLAGDFAGRWLAPAPDKVGLFRGIGSVLGACLYTWLYFKLFGPIGPYRPPKK